MTPYGSDLAYIHDARFGFLAEAAAVTVIETLQGCDKTNRLVVDLGCGSGILAERLSTAGYDVLGYDLSADMLQIARRRAPGAEFRQDSFLTARLPPCVAVTTFRRHGKAYRRRHETHLVRLLDADGIADELRSAGFRGAKGDDRLTYMSPPGSSNLSQYNLRTLFAAVALLAAVFAAARYGGGAGFMAAATVAALIAAHVIGNALGTRLRDEISPQFNPQPDPAASQRVRTRLMTAERRLHERTPLGRVIHITSGGAAIVGAVMGGLALAIWTEASPAGWLVGTVSSAVLGGFFGFMLASFLEMTIRAWWQAAGTHERED